MKKAGLIAMLGMAGVLGVSGCATAPSKPVERQKWYDFDKNEKWDNSDTATRMVILDEMKEIAKEEGAPYETLRKKIDSNGDGIVTKTEWNKYIEGSGRPGPYHE